MTVNKQILREIKRFLLYLFWLIVGSYIIIGLFSIIYRFKGISDSLKYSIEIFIGTTDINNQTYITSLVEIVVKYIFSVTFIAGCLTKFIEPINPVTTSRFFIYDEKAGEIKFRYWIILPYGEHLYNLHMRLFVITDDEQNAGEGSLDKYRHFIIENNVLELARGVRVAKLLKSDKDYPRILVDLLNSDDKRELCFIVTATTEKGRRINYIRKYTKNDLIKGCEFVSIRSTDFYPELKKKLFFRYHYFDKLFVKDDSDDNAKTNLLRANYPQAKKAILSEREIKVKKYGNIRYILKDLYSEFISWYLNS